VGSIRPSDSSFGARELTTSLGGFAGSLTTYDDKTKLIHAVRSFGVTLKQNKYGQKIYFLCERARSWAG
jgi:hypothetical protein